MADAEITVRHDRLKLARLKACLTQAELARAAGVRRETVHRLEAGLPSRLLSIRKICAALGIRPDEVIEVSEGAA